MGAGVRDAFPPPMCKCITEIGRGGAYVPARVAPQGRIRRSSPAHNACILRVGRLISFGVGCA